MSSPLESNFKGNTFISSSAQASEAILFYKTWAKSQAGNRIWHCSCATGFTDMQTQKSKGAHGGGLCLDFRKLSKSGNIWQSQIPFKKAVRHYLSHKGVYLKHSCNEDSRMLGHTIVYPPREATSTKQSCSKRWKLMCYRQQRLGQNYPR